MKVKVTKNFNICSTKISPPPILSLSILEFNKVLFIIKISKNFFHPGIALIDVSLSCTSLFVGYRSAESISACTIMALVWDSNVGQDALRHTHTHKQTVTEGESLVGGAKCVYMCEEPRVPLTWELTYRRIPVLSVWTRTRHNAAQVHNKDILSTILGFVTLTAKYLLWGCAHQHSKPAENYCICHKTLFEFLSHTLSLSLSGSPFICIFSSAFVCVSVHVAPCLIRLRCEDFSLDEQMKATER